MYVCARASEIGSGLGTSELDSRLGQHLSGGRTSAINHHHQPSPASHQVGGSGWRSSRSPGLREWLATVCSDRPGSVRMPYLCCFLELCCILATGFCHRDSTIPYAVTTAHMRDFSLSTEATKHVDEEPEGPFLSHRPLGHFHFEQKVAFCLRKINRLITIILLTESLSKQMYS